jgi:hypothetical protein
MLRQTISQSVCLGVKFTMEPVTRCYILSERCCVVSVGRPLWRESGLSSVSHFQQCLVHCQGFNIIYIVHVTCFKYVYVKYNRPQSAQAQYSRSCHNFRDNSSLDALTVVRLAAAKFKPLTFSVSGFALPNMADICIFMIFYNSCLLSA